jgi:hypothetical protein
MDEASILDELPVSLRTDVTTYNCRTLLQNVPFFQNCEPGLIPTVVRMLAPTIFLTGDVIVRYGEFPTEVYFIQVRFRRYRFSPTGELKYRRAEG